jgi:hypothetical protein
VVAILDAFFALLSCWGLAGRGIPLCSVWVWVWEHGPISATQLVGGRTCDEEGRKTKDEGVEGGCLSSSHVRDVLSGYCTAS